MPSKYRKSFTQQDEQGNAPPHRQTQQAYLRDERIARALAARAFFRVVPEAVAARRALHDVGEESAVHFHAPTALALVGGCGRGKECSGDCCGRLAFPVAIAVAVTHLLGCETGAVPRVTRVGLIVPPTATRGFLAVSLAPR